MIYGVWYNIQIVRTAEMQVQRCLLLMLRLVAFASKEFNVIIVRAILVFTRITMTNLKKSVTQ